ncbi:MAG: ATP-binding cassette domain-containing protein [Clostridium sp.]
MFEIKNITKQFGSEAALKDVSFKINGGMNFIIGSSGSGKTTLLKILCAMDQEFSGEAYYNGKSLKELGSKDKGSYYANEFGFVWQDFNLIEDLSVFENIKLPLYLNEKPSNKLVINTMKELKIYDLANQKVRNLSGGQKQRVAIARELVKNPEVIIADEPTAALDAKSAVIIMDLLKELSKSRMVIVVTHNTAFINEKCSVFELDKGELISVIAKGSHKSKSSEHHGRSKLSFFNSLFIAITNMKSKLGRFAILVLSIIVTGAFLLVSLSGGIQNSNDKVFNELIETYGFGILDISIAASFMSASGGDEQKPNTDVSQDISGLYDKYIADERVSHILFSQALNNLKVIVNGKEYSINSSNNVPVLNELVAGTTPKGEGNEVVVPQSFVKQLGISNEEAIGTEIEVDATIFNWTTGEPVEMPVKTSAKIVGVANTDMIFEYEGKPTIIPIDDSFFFSKSALFEMRTQAGVKTDSTNFDMRAKSPEDMISLKDELLANGIVPNGRFEMIEDIVRLQSQTKEQTGSSLVLISILALLVSVAISVITAVMRKHEYAIYKVNGFTKGNLVLLSASEYLLTGISAIIVFLVCSPVINLATNAMFGVSILMLPSLAIGTGLIVLTAVLCSIIGSIIAVSVQEAKSLKLGDKA